MEGEGIGIPHAVHGVACGVWLWHRLLTLIVPSSSPVATSCSLTQWTRLMGALGCGQEGWAEDGSGRTWPWLRSVAQRLLAVPAVPAASGHVVECHSSSGTATPSAWAPSRLTHERQGARAPRFPGLRPGDCMVSASMTRPAAAAIARSLGRPHQTTPLLPPIQTPSPLASMASARAVRLQGRTLHALLASPVASS